MLHDNHSAGRGTQYAWLVLLDTFIAGDLPFSRPQRVLKILKIIDNMFFSEISSVHSELNLEVSSQLNQF